jgi:gas vesicle protein
MRLAIGVAIGLLFGLAIGSVSMTFLYDRASKEVRRADRQSSNAQTASNTQTVASYICQWSGGTRESALLIKSDTSGAKEMIFPWKTDGDRFRIDETTDLHYIGTDIEEKKSEATVSTFDLNRVTGDLYIINRFTPKALQVMVALCQKSSSRKTANGKWGSWVAVDSIAIFCTKLTARVGLRAITFRCEQPIPAEQQSAGSNMNGPVARAARGGVEAASGVTYLLGNAVVAGSLTSAPPPNPASTRRSSA